MSSFAHSIVMSVPFARSVAIVVLMGTTMLASLPTAARAETVPDAVIQLAQADNSQSRAAAGATEAKGETVEQRIRNLQRALKITSDQEPKWNAVAQAMRENAIKMDTLIAENRKTPPQDMTAVDDLKSYQKHAQAHVDGLKNLIASFATLYDAMPDGQKRIADDVFRTSERERSPAPVVYGPFFPFFPFIR
jgi:protein CpxP